ncbi:MAG TPA: hypothetical protein VGZ22_21530 [Isosphaeraceae bacterium]|jgi:hypothetical protein|nr:hypothetical protein [Isosphaeraceae bacterium]
MRRTFVFVVAGALTWLVCARSGLGQGNAPAPDRIEEDWVLVIDTPDVDANGPQITTTMSPTADHSSSPFVAFDMNYREYPDFTPGGMQLQVWSGKDLGDTATHGSAQLNTSGETITWTQAMSLSGGSINYSIKNGRSQTWDDFGPDGNPLSVSFTSSLSSLTDYSPDVSLANSGATWQSNHVTSLAIVKVRYYSAGQLILTDTTRRDCPLPP